MAEYTLLVAKAYSWQNRTRQHYTTLPGSMASYGECTQTRTIENHVNLLVYIGKLLCTPEDGFQCAIKHQGDPFLGLAHVFPALIARNNCQNGRTRLHALSIIDQYTITYKGTSTICLHSIKSSLLSLYPLCYSCDKLFQALYRFSVPQVTES